jgi:hypothetical protein
MWRAPFSFARRAWRGEGTLSYDFKNIYPRVRCAPRRARDPMQHAERIGLNAPVDCRVAFVRRSGISFWR